MENIIITIPEEENKLKDQIIEFIKGLKLSYKIEKTTYDEAYIKSVENAREDYKKGIFNEIPTDIFADII